MSGADAVTVVWVAPLDERVQERDGAVRALEGWARARGLHVREAAGAAGPAALPVDLTIADRVEKELDRAREAIAAADADGAERALARAESTLREHPELPQAAWLRAEVNRSWASRWTRLEPRDEARAQTAWEEADALDGGRAAGIGEIAFPARPPAAATLTVAGGGSRAMVTRLDGVVLAGRTSGDGLTTYPLDVSPAEHQVVVTLDGEPVFASWITIAPARPGGPPPTIPLRIGDDAACSASSFAGVSHDAAGAVRAPGVTCDRWVAAAPTERRGAILVARCAGTACGPFVEWRSEGSFDAPGAAVVTRHGGPWPAWATWTALGVGVVAATTIALVATGVLEARPTEQRFVAGGVRVE